MKTNYLLAAVFSMACTAFYAQTWNNGAVTLTSDPIDTRVGVGINSLADFDNAPPTGTYSGANQVGLLLEGEVGSERGVFNYGHLLEGAFGAEVNDTRWFTLGGPGFTTADINLYGARFQFDEYAVNLALADRDLIGPAPGQESTDGGSLFGNGIKDAILFWNSGIGQDGVPLSAMRIGPTRGSGQIIRRIQIDGSREGNIEIRTGDDGFDGSGDINIFTEDAVNENGGSIFLTAGSSEDADAGDIILRTKLGDRDGNISLFGGGDIFLNVDPVFGLISLTGFVRANNDLQVLGTFTNPSDGRYKKNVESMTSEITDKLNSLNPTTYNFIEDSPVSASLKNNLQYGVIAQELEEVFPTLVMEDRDGFKTVNYLAFIPMLIQAHKDQQETIESLTAMVNELMAEKKINESGISGSAPNELDIIDATLSQNAPNPFSEMTTISYTLPATYQNAQLYILDMNGKQERSFVLDGSPIELSAYSLEAGLYMYSLVIDGKMIDTKKMLLTK